MGSGSPRNVLLMKGNYGRAGGPETLLSTTLRHIDRKRFCPTFVLLRKRGGPEHAPFLESGATVRELRWRGIAASPMTAVEVQRLAQRSESVLLHTHDMRANLTAFLLRRVRAMPWIAHVHGWLGPTHVGRWRWYERIDQTLVKYADLVLVGSDAVKQQVEALGVTRVRVLPNAIDVPHQSQFHAEVAEIRARIGATNGTVVIGSVGRVHPGKGQSFLVRSVAQLRDQGMPVRGLIVGEGPDLEPVRALVRQLNLENQVFLAGFQPDISPYLAAMDIFAAPSLTESLPVAVLEAMSAGCAVVATRVGDLPSVVTSGVTGLLVTPGNLDELTAALKTVVAQPALRTTMGDRARCLVRDRYSAAAMVRALENIYEDVAAVRGVNA